MQKVFDALKVKKALLVLGNDDNKNVMLSARNIEGIKTTKADVLNVYDILKYNTVVTTKAAVQSSEEVYA